MATNNPGITFQLSDTITAWMKFLEVYINAPAVSKSVRQIQYLASTITNDNKIAWLLRAITFTDLTTLSGDDTSGHVENLCKKAAKPVNLPFEWSLPLHTAAVCVYPSKVQNVVKALKKLNKTNEIKVASVAAGFPSGQYPLESRLKEVQCAIEYGAQEIDIVIDRSLVLDHEWLQLYEEIKAIRNVCNATEKRICLKVILSTGELSNYKEIYQTSMVAMFAGADFIKTSTGKETVNATLNAGIVMCRAIKEYERLTCTKVGIKPAGGIKTASDALEWMVLVKEELGNEWLTKDYFRIGASSLLDDIKREIDDLCLSECSTSQECHNYALEIKNEKPEKPEKTKGKSKKDKSDRRLEKPTS
ncbi:deoxyribose-phosphate aldolase [Linepithema humile]|uniref:deoxyribose-phosphate aldolase n=1 Tax=Linepithema humile TaxID=83485 RepID=UPI00351F3CCA